MRRFEKMAEEKKHEKEQEPKFAVENQIEINAKSNPKSKRQQNNW